MKKVISLLTVMALLLFLPVHQSEAAKSFGGSKSFGKSFKSSPTSPSSPSQPSQYNANKQAVNKTTPTGQTAKGFPTQRSSWLRWLPFVGLFMMMGHFGIGSIFSIFTTLLMLALLVMLWKRFRSSPRHY